MGIFRIISNKIGIILAKIFIVMFVVKIWSMVCVKTAVRLYFKNKNQWTNIYMITNMEKSNIYLQNFILKFHETIESPISIITLRPEECELSKDCKPSVILTDNEDYMYKSIKFYEPLPLSDSTLQYAEIINKEVIENKTIIEIKKEPRIYMAISKKDPYKNMSKLFLKNILLNDIRIRRMELKEQIKEVQKRKKLKSKRYKKSSND